MVDDPSPEAAGDPPYLWPQMTGAAIAAFLGVSAPWIRNLEKDGFVERLPNKLFDAGAVCKGYIAWLKDADRRSSKTEVAKRKEAAQLERIELENAKLRNDLVDIDLVMATCAEIFTTLRIELATVPAGSTRDLALREEIEKRLNDAFDRCGARLEAACTALRGGDDTVESDEAGES